MQCKVPTCIAFVIADYASVFEVAALACTCRWLRSVFSTRHDALYWPRLQRFSFVRVAATKATASTSPNAAQTQQRQLQPLSDGATERLQCLLGLLRTVRHVHIACEQLTGACLRALCESASDTLRTLRLERAVSMTMPDLLQSVQSCNHLQHLYVSNLWEAHDDDVFTCTSSKSADEFDEPVYARYKGGRNLFSSHIVEWNQDTPRTCSVGYENGEWDKSVPSALVLRGPSVKWRQREHKVYEFEEAKFGRRPRINRVVVEQYIFIGVHISQVKELLSECPSLLFRNVYQNVLGRRPCAVGGRSGVVGVRIFRP